MNIADAKRYVKDTVEAYMTTDADGLYIIEPEKQRPLFLIGAPGIGKTAIMSQVADELGVGLVSYSMTHHTRQSALGLPFIVHNEYEGYEYDSSEYTMSEIVASIYDYMKTTGLQKGILFLDEINCVSETLYPSMLQFLQFKTFGRHRVPDNWVVVCAGNPPEYNRSVHEFDIVTMDRMRKLAVEPDFEAWKAYASNNGVHPAVLSFLEAKRDCFYCVESTPEGKVFVTARGWDDLSRIITLFEGTGKPVDDMLIGQFVQDAEITEKFAVYYELFRKYRSDYQISSILDGSVGQDIVDRAKAAPFDERLALLGLILDHMCQQSGDVNEQETVLMQVRDTLRGVKEAIMGGASADDALKAPIEAQEREIQRLTDAKTSSKSKFRIAKRVLTLYKTFVNSCALAGTPAGEPAFSTIQQEFRGHVGQLEVDIKAMTAAMDNAFAFVENAFGDDREMLVFVTEVTARQATSLFVSKYGSEGYFKHNEALMVDRHREALNERIDSLRKPVTEQIIAKQEAAREAAKAASEGDADPFEVNAGELADFYKTASFEYGYASLCHMALPANLVGQRVLDIGCRRGKGIFKLSDRVGAKGSAVGIDWTAEHIQEAKERAPRAAQKNGFRNNMEFHLAFPEDLVSAGIGNSSVDTVFINSVLHLTYKPKAVLAEIYRVLKPGGTLVLEVALATGTRDGEVVEAARKIGNSIQAAPGRADFEEQLKAVGFSSIELQEEYAISPATGYKFDFEVETAPSDETVTFNATVLHVIK